MKQWKELFQQEEQKEYYRKLMQFLDEEYAHRTIYPPREDLFTCFTSCPFEAVKVVILGQDPYISQIRRTDFVFLFERAYKYHAA